MPNPVLAVYENGVLHPTRPLELAEGETVELTVSKPKPPERPPVSMEEWERRLRSAKTIQEWVDLANSCPDPGPDYDIMKLLNESRRLTGFRLPDPEPGEPTTFDQAEGWR
jgi:predicted DNA-binding antitoxin AbrB/MazE fold protein